MNRAVIGLKPGLDGRRLIDLAKEVVDPGGYMQLVSLVQADTRDDELARLEAANSEVATLALDLRDEGYEVNTQVQVASVALGGELARIAERIDADLLVIGLAKRSRVGKALLGSDAQSAIMAASCPVLATRLA